MHIHVHARIYVCIYSLGTSLRKRKRMAKRYTYIFSAAVGAGQGVSFFDRCFIAMGHRERHAGDPCYIFLSVFIVLIMER